MAKLQRARKNDKKKRRQKLSQTAYGDQGNEVGRKARTREREESADRR